MAGDRMPSVEDKTPSIEEKQATYAHTADAETGYSDKERPVDLTKPNVEGRLRNPLSGVPRQTLLRDVDAFVAEKGIEEERELFHKAALVAQSPTRYNDLDMLDDADRNILEREQTHRWSHPVTLYVTILICSVGAATQGWDQTGSNGANLSFPAEFSLAGTERGEWLVGLINAAPYIASAVFGCWLSDPLNNFFGRRGTIFITALILIATPIASGFTHSWQTLFVVRLILGIGMGAKGATVPIFAAENSPTTIRGALVMSWQLWTAFGIFLGFCANAAVIDTGAIAWRLQLGSAFIPAVPLALGIFFVPESPRWLMKKNRYQEAYKSLCRLRFTRLQAARDLYYIHVQLEEEKKIIQGASYIQRFTELFTIPRVRRATLAASTVMLGQQMCGINIIAFYSSTVFVQAGSTERQALYASIGFGAVNFVFAFPALITIDRFGRRSLLLFAFPFMALTLLGAGLCFLAPNMPNPDYPATSDLAEIATKGKLAGIALFIYIFTAFYSTSEGPVPFTLSAEVFPLAQREQGMSWAVATCLFWAAVLSITFPRMLSQMMPVGAFCFYAGLNVIALVLIFFFVPETAGRSLEELDQVFNMPTATFARHQVRHSLPYFFKRFVCFNKNAKPVPLYKTDDGQEFLG